MTRHFSLAVVCLAAMPFAAFPLVAAAQGRYQPRGYPTCAAPPSCEARPTCEGAEPNCDCKPPCKPPCNQPPPQQMPMYYQPPGVFVQPPASGTVQGPVESTTVQGAELSFPEMRLRMPSLKMPSISKTRQNARMLLDQAVAPFQESPAMPLGPAAPAAPVAAPAAAPVAAPQMMMAPAPQMQMMMAPAAPQMQVAMAPAAPQMQMMMAPAAPAPQMQMMLTPVQMAPQQYYIPQQAPVQQPQAPVQPMQAPQPEPEAAPRMQPNCPPQPSCDARGYSLNTSAAEEKIRQLELAEQQLKQRMEVLRRQLEQVELSKRPPTPAPDLGARAIQLPGGQQLRPTSVQPVSQPIVQPQPVRQSGPTPAQPQTQPAPSRQVYEARPASYVNEPRYAPQYQPQYPQPQYPQPQYQQPQYQAQPMTTSPVIREPQVPAANIVGLRIR